MAEHQLPFEYHHTTNSIGLSPNMVLSLGTEYGAVACIQFDEHTLIAGRIEPIPFELHGSNRVFVNKSYQVHIQSKEGAPCLLKMVEPDFTQVIKVDVPDESLFETLSPLVPPLEEMSIVFKGMLLRHENKTIYQISSIDDGESFGIATNDTIIDIPPAFESDDAEDIPSSEESSEQTKTDASESNHRPITEFSHSPAPELASVGFFDDSFPHLSALKGIDSLISQLLMEVILPFVEILENPGTSPLHKVGATLFYGPPGTGKTAIAHAIAKDLGLPFFNVKIGDLASPFVHQFAKNLSSVFEIAAKQKQGAIIFLDELDAFAGDRKGMNSHDKENVNALLQELDPSQLPAHVLVFGATNFISSLDKAVVRSGRFDTKIAVLPPDRRGRGLILRQKIQELNIELGNITEIYLNKLNDSIQGYVGADIDTLVKKAFSLARFDARSSKTQIKLLRKHLDAAREGILPLCQLELNITPPKVTIADLPGSEHFIESIHKEVTALLYPERFRSDITYSPDRGFILYGEPGTGKTSIAHAIAHEANLLLKVVKGTEFVRPEIGLGQQEIRAMFEQAELFQPIMIFIDEIDAITKDREKYGGRHEEMLNALMSEIDTTEKSNKVIVVGATNHLNAIDPALRRPGRLGRHFHVAAPDLEQTELILTHKFSNIPNSLKASDFKHLAEALFTKKSTQAQISDFVNRVMKHLFFHTKEEEPADLEIVMKFIDPEDFQ